MKRAIFTIGLLLVLVLLGNVYAQIGITELSGTPKITSCVKEITFYSGYSSQGNLEVENIGQQDGQFDLIITCNKESVSGTGYIGLVESGEKVNVNILISGTSGTENPLVAICTYIITDRKGKKSDSCSSSVIIKYSTLQCQPGTYLCENDNLYKCSNNGMQKELVKKCIKGCGYDSTLIQSACKENINEPTNYAIPIIIGIAIIIGFLILALILKNRK